MKRIMMFAAAALLAVSANAQQSQPIPVDPAVRIGRLDNGITYYIRHNEEPQGQANFYIAQKVGSILEEENQRGLAHFLEHMCFNGTEHFPGNGLIDYCERIGVKFGQNLNAYTSIDETVYNIDNVPVGTVPSAIDSCLWILHDWADGLLLADEDIDKERGVIHEEWRSRAGAQIRMLEKSLPVVYPDGNRYGHRLPIGLMSVVDSFPYQVLRDYYEKWYRTDLQGIIVVGDIDVDSVEEKIKEIFGSIEPVENPAERISFEVPDNTEPIICLAKDKEQPYAISLLYLKHDPYPQEMRSDISYYVFSYAMAAASQMANARLQEMLQSPNPPFIQADITDGEFFIARTAHALTGEVVSSENDIMGSVTALYREMLRAVRCGFTASEYERAKSEIVSAAESAYNARDKKKSAEYCSEYVRHFIDNEPIPGLENEFALISQFSEIIDVNVINQIVANLVEDNNMVLLCMLPDKEGVVYPTEAEMAAALAAVGDEDIQPYEDAVSDEPLVSDLPAAGRITSRKSAPFGYTLYRLSNGAKVYFRHTDFNPDEVLMDAFSSGGKSLYDDSDLSNLKVVNELATIGGLGNFNKVDLSKALSGKKVSWYPTIGLLNERISLSSTPKDIETMFQLNYLFFTSIREDADAFESWKNRVSAALANRELEPTNALKDSLMNTIYVKGNRAEDFMSADLAKVDYRRSLDIARERFANAADFTFIITGAVEEAVLLPLLEQYVAALPSSAKREKADPKYLEFAKGSHNVEFERGMEVPMVTNFFFDSSKADFSLKNALAFELALNALSVVLLEEIREKEGGTYGIGAYGEMSGRPCPEAYMQISYQASPDRYEYLNGRVREIVKQFAEDGPSEENLAKGKEFMLKTYRENQTDNSYWKKTLRTLLETRVDMQSDFETALESITVEDARKAVISMLKHGNHAEVIMVGTPK